MCSNSLTRAARWQALDENKGAVYYDNKATGQTTWQKPTAEGGGRGGGGGAGGDAAGGALAALPNGDAEDDALFKVHDDNAWKSRGTMPPADGAEAGGSRERADGEGSRRAGVPLTYNPTAKDTRSEMGGWAKKIVSSGAAA